MSVPEWFGAGAGAAAALWWWRYVVQRCIWDDGPAPVGDNPVALDGILLGTLIWAFSPVWLPVYAARYVGHRALAGALSRRSNAALLRAFPDRGRE